MGLSASQGRLLMLTARQNDLEYQAQQISHQRLALAAKLDDISQEYETTVNNRQMIITMQTSDGSPVISNLTYAKLVSGAAALGTTSGLNQINGVNTTDEANPQAFRLSDGNSIVVSDVSEIPGAKTTSYSDSKTYSQDSTTKFNFYNQTQKEVNKLRNKIRDLGSINIDAIEEYKKAKERYDFMSEQRLDLENTQAKLRNVITEMTKTMKTQFAEKFALINKNFNEVFQELFGGGKAELVLEDEDNILECGIDIRVQPTGKKLQNMMLLSGGEKAFTAIALLFAILKINPAPFCILDEIEAALDDVNVYRYADYLKKFSDETQFLVITHRKGTMEAADTVYGITMEENGISKLLSIKMA